MTEATAEVEKTKSKPKQRSYFNTGKLNRFLLDDNESWIEHQQLDEGLYESYQDLTSSVKLDREGETTEVDMALGSTRRFLIENLVVSWNLVDENGDPVPFAPKKVRTLPPHIIGNLIEDIYEHNPILSGEDGGDEGKTT
jgi:hypothetical protein